MQLNDLYRQLSEGELRHMFAGMDGTGDIDYADQSRVIGLANRGLKRLYTRFIHARGYLQLQVHANIKKYALTSKFAVSNTDPANTATRYILDTTDDPFTDDVIKILAIRNENAEFESQKDLTLNDRNGSTKIRTNSFNELYLPNPEEDFIEPAEGSDVVLTVEYQKEHPTIPLDAPRNTEIVLMPLLQEALGFYVAGRIFSSIPSESNIAQAQTCFREYERLCLMTEEDDLAQESSSENNDKFSDRGFM